MQETWVLSWFEKILWRKEWQPTPLFLPGKTHVQRTLVGCRLWGRTESATTESTQQQHQQALFIQKAWKRHRVVTVVNRV